MTGPVSFGKRLKSIVRMGPNVVGVGSCEDSETAEVICDTAKEGQILYVAMEANNAVEAIIKWIKMVGNKDVAFENLLGVSNQRLIRKLCDECKEAYTPHRDLLRKFNIPAEDVKVLYRPGKPEVDRHGKPILCEKCQGTGFFGRTGIFEVVNMTDELKKALKQAKSIAEISAALRGAKTIYLQESALEKTVKGITAINEVIRIFSKSADPKSTSQAQNGAG